MPAYNARVAFNAHNSSSGALITNVVHVEVDTLSSPPNWGSIAGDINTWLGTQWRNILTTHDVFDSIVVTDEDYPGSTLGQGVVSLAAVGTRTTSDTDLSPGLCAIGTFKSSVAKRYARGHVFFPPAYNSGEMIAGGLWSFTSSYTIACAAWHDQYRAGHTSGSSGYVPIIYSRTRQKRGESPFTFPIVAGIVRQGQFFLRSRTTAP